MSAAMQNQKAAVNTGQWLLYRYHPDRAAQDLNPLVVDSKPPAAAIEDFLYRETRFKMLTKSKPAEAKRLLRQAQEDVRRRWALYEHLASRRLSQNGGAPPAA
jgi:pyruvate-ferredoxin/flavodoxin oxidoreductase